MDCLVPDCRKPLAFKRKKNSRGEEKVLQGIAECAAHHEHLVQIVLPSRGLSGQQIKVPAPKQGMPTGWVDVPVGQEIK